MREAAILVAIGIHGRHISIHASRERSDVSLCLSSDEDNISIHASRERSDINTDPRYAVDAVFQSTLPAKEATGLDCSGDRRRAYFNPRFPRGKRLECNGHYNLMFLFQSTLPQEKRPVGS